MKRLTYEERKDIEEVISLFFDSWVGTLSILCGWTWISLDSWMREDSILVAVVRLDRQIARSCGIGVLQETEDGIKRINKEWGS